MVVQAQSAVGHPPTLLSAGQAQSGHHILRPRIGIRPQNPARLWLVLGPKLCPLKEPQWASALPPGPHL